MINAQLAPPVALWALLGTCDTMLAMLANGTTGRASVRWDDTPELGHKMLYHGYTSQDISRCLKYEPDLAYAQCHLNRLRE